jgi:hypothetical protein
MLFRLESVGDAGSRFQFDLVTLAVIEAERVTGKTTFQRDGQTGAGIEAATEEADCFGLRHFAFSIETRCRQAIKTAGLIVVIMNA